MATQTTARHPFRFGVVLETAPSGTEWLQYAQQVEATGYDAIAMPDHFGRQMSPFPALAAAAVVTKRLRLGGLVMCNDYRHPALLAKEVATLDVLSEGRAFCGIGAGWLRAEYNQLGLPFDSAGTRIERLGEAVTLMKRIFSGDPVSARGKYYRVWGLQPGPKSVQSPWPPILIGGGSRKILALAGAEADIVGINVDLRSGEWSDPTVGANVGADATAEKIDWIRAAAGSRFDELEIQIAVFAAVVTDDARRTVGEIARSFEISEDAVIESPHFLIGSVHHVVEVLRARRERYGTSFMTIQAGQAATFAPVVEMLAGT